MRRKYKDLDDDVRKVLHFDDNAIEGRRFRYEI